jgi:hypothetical protein
MGTEKQDDNLSLLLVNIVIYPVVSVLQRRRFRIDVYEIGTSTFADDILLTDSPEWTQDYIVHVVSHMNKSEMTITKIDLIPHYVDKEYLGSKGYGLLNKGDSISVTRHSSLLKYFGVNYSL